MVLLQKHLKVTRSVSSHNEYYVHKICRMLQYAISNAQFGENEKCVLLNRVGNYVTNFF